MELDWTGSSSNFFPIFLSHFKLHAMRLLILEVEHRRMGIHTQLDYYYIKWRWSMFGLGMEHCSGWVGSFTMVHPNIHLES